MYTEIHTKPSKSIAIPSTGDIVAGDTIRFTEGVFAGSWRNPKLSHHRTITAKVLADSYGAAKQQHTFTLKVIAVKTDAERRDVGRRMLGNTDIAIGSKIKRKGRNVYRHGTFRKAWDDESQREAVAAEKHDRGDVARQAREARRAEERITKPWKF